MKKNRSKMNKHLTLDILYCIHCKQNPISKDTFPHYCKACVEYLSQYGKLPDIKYKQEDLDKEYEYEGEDGEENSY